MQLSAKYSGAREPTFADVDVILLMVVVGKCEEASKTISNEKVRLLLSSTTVDMYTGRCYVIHRGRLKRSAPAVQA